MLPRSRTRVGRPWGRIEGENEDSQKTAETDQKLGTWHSIAVIHKEIQTSMNTGEPRILTGSVFRDSLVTCPSDRLSNVEFSRCENRIPYCSEAPKEKEVPPWVDNGYQRHKTLLQHLSAVSPVLSG